MANAPKITAVTCNTMLDAGIGTLVNSGIIRLYTTPQPASADDAVTTQTPLVDLTLNADAFPGAGDRVLTANAITDGTVTADGIATWFRLLKSDGTTVVMDGSVGTSGCDLNLDSIDLTTGSKVSITSATITHPSF